MRGDTIRRRANAEQPTDSTRRNPSEGASAGPPPSARGPRPSIVSSAALVWGLQFAFFNPALALLLASRFDATSGQIGVGLAIYNGSGFVSALLIPMLADRRADYLTPLMWSGLATVPLMGALGLSDDLAVAFAALLLLGGPASVGSSLLFAHVRAAGLPARSVISTRAVVSFAWVAGPPLAALIAGAFGDQAVLVAIAAIAVLGLVITHVMRRGAPSGRTGTAAGENHPRRPDTRLGPVAMAGTLAAFLALHATNVFTTSVMALYVTQTLRLPVIWAGTALAVAAALEIPALLLAGRLARRYSAPTLITAACAIGAGYYLAMALVRGPADLVAAQVLNASFFAVLAGTGLTYFQEIIAAPGLASGLFTNVRRLGAVVAGGLVALAPLLGGYRHVFVSCAALTVLALLTVGAISLHGRRKSP